MDLLSKRKGDNEMDILSVFLGVGIGFLAGVISGSLVFSLCMVNKTNIRDIEEQINTLSSQIPQLDDITAQDLANDYNAVPIIKRR